MFKFNVTVSSKQYPQQAGVFEQPENTPACMSKARIAARLAYAERFGIPYDDTICEGLKEFVKPVNYYAGQLAKFGNLKLGSAPRVQITHDDVRTNWMSLCDESASELVKWLSEHYTITL